MSTVERMIASIQARIVYPYIQNHFNSTKNGRLISKYQNKYKNRRCFFIGNGPSLQVKDLDILLKSGEITFAFNRIYNIFSQSKWRPTFYISQKKKMLLGCVDIVDKLDLPVKFIPIQLKWYYGINIHDAIYFNMNWNFKDKNNNFLFSDDAAQQLICGDTVMYTAAQLAIYMGFTEIYLIGVDHHFHISQNNKGEIIIDNKVKDYFSDDYNIDKEKLYIPNTEKSTSTYISIKNYCNKNNVKVYNATRGGRLEVFKRVDFDSLF